jgi:glycosyltransferase involved in cell wall biosynthesis
MNKDLVSVVIPTYNYGQFVTDAVESVLAQTYTPIEIIVVDDGSVDDTRSRLEPYGDRIRYIYQPNQGLPAARNTGILAARGELIAFLDSDDQWHPRKLELQMMYLARHPETGLVATTETTGADPKWIEVDDSTTIPDQPVSVKELMIRSRFGSCGVLVRKKCFDTVGLFDVDLRSAEDRDMWIRIANKFHVTKLMVPLWWYRKHGNNMSSVAVKMEQYEMRVLRNAFASINSLRYNYLLKMIVYSYTLKSAGYRYDSAGMRLQAIGRVLYSLLLWPFPFRSEEALTRFERPKMLVLFCLRSCRSFFRQCGVNSIPG